MIDPSIVANSIQNQISATVEDVIKEYVSNIINELSLDSAWISKIEQQVNSGIANRFGQKLSIVDIDSLVAEHIDSAVERYYGRRAGPFSGIKDQSSQVELTIDNGKVTVENDLEAGSLNISTNATIKDTLVVQNLAVKGSINTDNHTWQQLTADIAEKAACRLTDQWRESLIQQVRETIQQHGIEFDQVTVGGQALVNADTLSSHVTNSSLRTLGILDSLQVKGESNLGDSLSVRPRRVGINTQHPDMALSIWDEEVALVFGKHKEQTAYVGTLRPQRMIIGVNRTAAIDINEQGRVIINHLTVGRHRICHEPECPNYSGTKGDIVFNSNPKNDGVWGWQCQGAFRWVPLKSA